MIRTVWPPAREISLAGTFIIKAMAILKRRLMREKKTPPAKNPAEDATKTAPTDKTEQPPQETLPENPVETEETLSEQSLPDSTITPEQPAESVEKNKNPDAEPDQNITSESNETATSDTASDSISQQQETEVESPPEEDSIIETNPPARTKSNGRRFSLVQLILAAVVLISTTLLAFSFVLSFKKSALPASAIADSVTGFGVSINKGKGNITKTQIQQEEQPAKTEIPEAIAIEQLATNRTEPLSLQQANDYYKAKEYVKAYNIYEQLYKNLTGPDFELIRNFLQFRMALCLENKQYFDKARQIYISVAESRSPVLRILANYHDSLLEMNAGQYLKARTRAYKAIALAGLLSAEYDWALDLERDGSYIAAEAVTRQVMSLCDVDGKLPQEFLSKPGKKDHLGRLNEAELQTVLASGMERLNNGLLAPQIRPVESISGSPKLNRWLVVCNGPGINELMARFAANASLDVRWTRVAEDDESKRSNTAGWNRPVSLYLPAATSQQVAETAAGAAGLMAQIDDACTITIINPSEYSALSEHTRQLSENAMWLWRTFLLMYSDDARIPNVHFALGILQENRGRIAEAITEYKLVAHRYSQSPIAPFALLRSSHLKATLRDYPGAGSDLKEFIEQYPDNALADQAHLNLAEITMKAGRYDEACSLYRKTYNLGFSEESRTIAAFGAGCCYYQTKEYENAVKWLTQYLGSLSKQPDSTAADNNAQRNTHLYTAYLLLGKANLAIGNLKAACNALKHTLKSASASGEYVEAVSALVDAQIRQKDLVEALGTIENVRAWPFSQEQITKLLLLKSNILRAMGLPDQAITILTDKAPYLTDSLLKADIMLELAECYLATENLELAREHLTQALSIIEPGPAAQQASIKLAKICLELNDHPQTISICRQLLATSTDERVKLGASKILASAYRRQQEYDKAAEALLTASVLSETTKSITEKD